MKESDGEVYSLREKGGGGGGLLEKGQKKQRFRSPMWWENLGKKGGVGIDQKGPFKT